MIGGLAGLVIAFFGVFSYWFVLPLIVFGLIFDYRVSQNYTKPGRTAWWAGGGLGSSRSSGLGGGFGGFGGGGSGGGGSSGGW